MYEYENKPHHRIYTDYYYSHITQKVFKRRLTIHLLKVAIKKASYSIKIRSFYYSSISKR